MVALFFEKFGSAVNEELLEPITERIIKENYKHRSWLDIETEILDKEFKLDRCHEDHGIYYTL